MARSGRGRLGSRGLARRADPLLCQRRRVVFPLPWSQGQAVAALSAQEVELPLPTPSPSTAEPARGSAAARGPGRGLPRSGPGPRLGPPVVCLRCRRPDPLRHEASQLGKVGRPGDGRSPFPLRVRQDLAAAAREWSDSRRERGNQPKQLHQSIFIIDRCYVLAGRKFYFSLVSRSGLEKESYLASF